MFMIRRYLTVVFMVHTLLGCIQASAKYNCAHLYDQNTSKLLSLFSPLLNDTSFDKPSSMKSMRGSDTQGEYLSWYRLTRLYISGAVQQMPGKDWSADQLALVFDMAAQARQQLEHKREEDLNLVLSFGTPRHVPGKFTGPRGVYDSPLFTYDLSHVEGQSVRDLNFALGIVSSRVSKEKPLEPLIRRLAREYTTQLLPSPKEITLNPQAPEGTEAQQLGLAFLGEVHLPQKALSYGVRYYQSLAGEQIPSVMIMKTLSDLAIEVDGEVTNFGQKRGAWVILRHSNAGLGENIFLDSLERLVKAQRETSKEEFFRAMHGYYNSQYYARGSAAIGNLVFDTLHEALFGESIRTTQYGYDVLAMLLSPKEYTTIMCRHFQGCSSN